MIDLTTKGLPNVVEINGKLYSVYTDFRIWMKFAISVQNLRVGERVDVSYLFKNNHPRNCDIRPLLDFCFPKNELPRKTNSHSDEILFDYEIDSDYIYAAFMSQYGIDLVDVKELHWYKFLALFKGLKDDEMICRIMGYRGYEKLNDKEDRFLKKKEEWRIERITPEEQEEIDRFSNLFS